MISGVNSLTVMVQNNDVGPVTDYGMGVGPDEKKRRRALLGKEPLLLDVENSGGRQDSLNGTSQPKHFLSVGFGSQALQDQ